MSALDKAILAEKAAAVERLPEEPSLLKPSTDAADAVILHLWQAVQIVIDLALATCVRKNLGTPTNYGEAFLRLAAAGLLDKDLADRLVLASGFRNAVAHNYEDLDMNLVYEAASKGPADLRAFLAVLRDRI